MIALSPQQRDIVSLPLKPICITACAGSGKTRTATYRLREMRRLLDDRHGIAALLSFSNVAVNTFRHDYQTLLRTELNSKQSAAVEIDTVDGFITKNIIRPHAHRTMGTARTPFLVLGREPFLNGFTVFDGKRPHPTADLRISLDGSAFAFEVGETYAPIAISPAVGEKALGQLGKQGAYTHSSGRYWALRTLREQPFVLRALARRFPVVIVDEAQDIGPEHQAILELMVANGSMLSLIGDANQGIYDFSGATGAFLSDYATRSQVAAHSLTKNYRSVPAIVAVANKLSGRSDCADRETPETLNGAYYLPYKKTEKAKLLSAFHSMLTSAIIDSGNAKILCRSTPWVEEWQGGEELQGQGIVRSFATACVCRNKLKRYDEAFKHTCLGLIALLEPRHSDLWARISGGDGNVTDRQIKRAIWKFARDHSAGLPSGELAGSTEWHPTIVPRVMVLLELLEKDFLLKAAGNLGKKLAKKALLPKPLVEQPDLAAGATPIFAVSTVHQVKGESIDAVMYVADKKQISDLIGGTKTEVGRIGYVAVTRARNLMVLAVPEKDLTELEPALIACGFRKPGS